MRSSVFVVAAGAVLALAGTDPVQATERGSDSGGSAPVTIVGPLDPNGAVKVSGSATVSGTVAATQSGAWSVGQSGPWSMAQAGAWSVGQAGAWSVGLEGPASAALANIDAATAGLRYDTDGNLKVNVSGGSAADPSVADSNPFGWSATSSIPGNDSAVIEAYRTVYVTAYSFHADRDMIITFGRGDSTVAFGVRVPAGQSIVGSFAHAIPCDRLRLRCMGGDTCTFLQSVAAYE